MTATFTTSTYSDPGATTMFRKDFPRHLTSTSTGHSGVDEFITATFGGSPESHSNRQSIDVQRRIADKFDQLSTALVTDDRLSGIPSGLVREYLNWLKASPTINEGLKLLEGDLASRKDLLYHNTSHTWDVLREFSVIAMREKLSLEDIKLGAIGSVFHDLGFLKQNPRNEAYGSACLVHFHDSFQREFNDPDSNRLNNVVQSILDTRPLPVEGKPFVFVARPSLGPHERIASCLLDADVANFGRADFIEKATHVFAEIKRFDSAPTITEMLKSDDGVKFLQSALGMLQSHSFWSESARRMFNAGKTENISRLEELLGHVAVTS